MIDIDWLVISLSVVIAWFALAFLVFWFIDWAVNETEPTPSGEKLVNAAWWFWGFLAIPLVVVGWLWRGIVHRDWEMEWCPRKDSHD